MQEMQSSPYFSFPDSADAFPVNRNYNDFLKNPDKKKFVVDFFIHHFDFFLKTLPPHFKRCIQQIIIFVIRNIAVFFYKNFTEAYIYLNVVMVPKFFNEVKKKKFEKRLQQQMQQKQLKMQAKPDENVNIVESITNNNDINDNELRTLLFFILALQYIEEFIHIIGLHEGQVNLDNLPKTIQRKTSIDYYNTILKVFALFWSLIPCNVSYIQSIYDTLQLKQKVSQAYKIVCENLKTNLILDKIFKVRRPVLIGKGCHDIRREDTSDDASSFQGGGGQSRPPRYPTKPVVSYDIDCSTMTGIRMDETGKQIIPTNTLPELVGNIALYIHRIRLFSPDFYHSLVDCGTNFDRTFFDSLTDRPVDPNKKMRHLKNITSHLKKVLPSKK